MRIKSLLLTCIFCAVSAFAQTIEYKVITTVESIVTGGMGRSRIVEIIKKWITSSLPQPV